MSDKGVNGPVEVQMLVHVTNGQQDGVATIGMGLGNYPTPLELAERLSKFERDELPSLSPGFRLQTSTEFFDTACMEKTGQTFATPASWLHWKPID